MSKAAVQAAEPRRDGNLDLEIKVTTNVLVSGLVTAMQKRMGGEGRKTSAVHADRPLTQTFSSKKYLLSS